jgi:cyclophilin family peptidyl-prolyl cis-trans isomerase
MSNKITSLLVGIIVVALMAGCLGNPTEAKRNEEPAQSPKIAFSTSEGEFIIQLYPDNAPETCKRFTMWCKGVPLPDGRTGESLYIGLQFYRVLPGKFVEGGDPFNRGQGADTFKYPFEKTYKSMKRGRVCMSNDKAGSNSSIFFILLTDNPKLEGMYTVFGEVTFGLEVVDKISNVPTGEVDKNKPITPVTINGIRFDE